MQRIICFLIKIAFFLFYFTAVGQAQDVQVIDPQGDAGKYNSLAIWDGQIAIAYQRDSNLLLWLDDGRDGGIAKDRIPNGGEIRTLETGDTGYDTVLDSWQDYLVLAWWDRQSGEIKLWIDDGLFGGTAKDGLLQSGEVRILASLWGSGHIDIAITHQGFLAVSFQQTFGIGQKQLWLWVDDQGSVGLDIPGDGIPNGSDIRLIDDGGGADVGAFTALAITKEGYLALAYQDETAGIPMLWVDDGRGGGVADDAKASSGEIRVMDVDTGAPGNGLHLSMMNVDGNSGYLAASYYNAAILRLSLWVDDGSRGGIAGNLVPEIGEVRILDDGFGGSRGRHADMLVRDGVLAISAATLLGPLGLGNLDLWVDHGQGAQGILRDYESQPEENVVIDHDSVGFSFTSIADNPTHTYISYYDESSKNLKLARIARANVHGPGTVISMDPVDVCQPMNAALTIDRMPGGENGRQSLIDYAGKLAAAYSGIDGVRLWLDDGLGGGIPGDEVPNGNEIRSIDSFASYLTTPSHLTIGPEGLLAIVYYSSAFDEVRLWLDDGRGGGVRGDAISNGDEIRIVATNVNSLYPKVGVWNQKLAVVYSHNMFADMGFSLWYDDGLNGGISGDGEVQPGEVRRIEADGCGNPDLSIFRGNLAISYPGGAACRNLNIWVDDGAGGGVPGDALVNGNEIRRIHKGPGPFWANIEPFDGFMGMTFLNNKFSPPRVQFWYDNGQGGGVAGDLKVNGAELHQLDVTATIKHPVSLEKFAGYFVTAHANWESENLLFWVDGGCNFGMEGNLEVEAPGEIDTLIGFYRTSYPTLLVRGDQLWMLIQGPSDSIQLLRKY